MTNIYLCSRQLLSKRFAVLAQGLHFRCNRGVLPLCASGAGGRRLHALLQLCRLLLCRCRLLLGRVTLKNDGIPGGKDVLEICLQRRQLLGSAAVRRRRRLQRCQPVLQVSDRGPGGSFVGCKPGGTQRNTPGSTWRHAMHMPGTT